MSDLRDRVRGPLAPSTAAQRPLSIDDVEIHGGPFGRWQRINREASIPLGLQQMEKSGATPNLRLAAGEGEGTFQGYRFQDSDLYKQLEAVAWEHCRRPDGDDAAAYRAFVAESAALLARAQRPDGYLNSHYQVVKPDKIFAELEHSHEMYCAGHLFQAAVATARAGLGDGLLEVARRFADLLVRRFLTGGDDGIDGHAEVETALVELYRLTGERTYLELACKLIDNRGRGLIARTGLGPLYAQDHLPVREAPTAVGHAVRQLYLEAGVVDVAVETGDADLLASSVRRWEDLVATKTAITGGHGSRHDGEAFGERYELPPDRSYNESCAAIAAIHWNWRLLLATGSGRYADLIERTLHNAFAASTSADGVRFFYVNPLQRRADLFEDAYLGRRREWFACACCPPNIMRLVSSLGHYVATTDDEGVSVHQYAPGVIRAGGITLDVETEYPWDGSVRLTVRSAPGGAWTLRMRVPAWSGSARLTPGWGEPYPAVPGADGYAAIRREWRAGDTVTLDLDLTPRLVVPHRGIDALRGCAAVERGPIVYCFEQIDQDSPLEDLALLPGAGLRPVERDLPGIGRTVIVEADAVRLPPAPPQGLPYTTVSDAAPATGPATAVAVPYYQWDNRDGGVMRVWMPLAQPSRR
ncbi:glycoside hydrolase family 127 protein [Nonomuraea sp. MG754425]|uniref:glycoside hydrolase family 127 protein n=1 Tax=Nonomuraea sp. MG754425 TaxID=2570319 RepID=UPI001F3C5FA0|nr:beta-L-arabinofuranosidase domain-containing protein [Nonomuraea sp. MG754425]MCF6470295.1 glycoside hydrolase family 127 protein [Nonomuraea sp. MG754425]